MQIFNNHIAYSNYVLQSIPERIEYEPNTPAKIVFNDEHIICSGCIGCTNPKCRNLSITEIGSELIDGFSFDRNRNACPVDAIEWDNEQNMPIINTDKCIKCGICIRRCPVGAIYYDNDIRVSRFSEEQYGSEVLLTTEHEQKEFIEELQNVDRSGVLIYESDELFTEIYRKISRLNASCHNLIGRNLLISLCSNCAISRIGDVYSRMDAVYSSCDNCVGPVEIEFGADTLEASRGILDDIAMLQYRYGINKLNTTPLVICLHLPNGRQGYWQVVKDIKSIEDIYVQTLTVGALMLLVWNGSWFLPDDVTFYVDYDNMSLRNTIEWLIGRSPNISDKHLGILEPNR